jgi:hypothetical protein
MRTGDHTVAEPRERNVDRNKWGQREEDRKVEETQSIEKVRNFSGYKS